MLNELKAISDKIEEMGVCEESLHPHIIKAPRGDKKTLKFKVLIGSKGKIDTVEQVDQKVWAGDDEGHSGFYYIYEGAKNQYPITKLSNIWDVGSDDYDSFFKKTSLPEISEKKFRGPGKILKWLKIEEVLLKILPREPKVEGIFLLAERFSYIRTDADYNLFFKSIFKKIFSMFPIETEKPGGIVKKDILNGVYLSFDITEGIDEGINPICYIDTMEVVSDILKQKDEEKIEDVETGKLDIFGNNFQDSNDGKLGQFNLDGQKFYPYSRNINSPCFGAYSLNGVNACELSLISKKHITEKMQYLFKPEHKGTYWSKHNNKDKTKDIFLVFAPVDKEILLDFQQSYIGDSSSFTDTDVKDESKKIISKLKGSDAYKNDERAYFMSFRSPSNGPSRLVLSESITLQSLTSFAEKWVEGWKNISKGTIPVKKGESKRLASTLTIQELRRIINKRWNRTASPSKGSKEFEFDFMYTNEVFNLFLGGKNELEKATKILSSHHIYLLIDVVNRIQNNITYEILYGHRRDIFKLPVVFGEIFHQHGISEEDYETNTAYLVGKSMALVSKVQGEYLESQKRKMPRRFTGTEYIHNSLNNPVEAMEMLLDFAKYYLARVKVKRTVDYKIDHSNKSFYNYYELSKTLGILKDSDFDKKWNHLERMLLAFGYFQNRDRSYCEKRNI